MLIKSANVSASVDELMTADLEVYLNTQEDKEMLAKIISGKGSGEYELVEKKKMAHTNIVINNDAKITGVDSRRILDQKIFDEMVQKAALKEAARHEATLMKNVWGESWFGHAGGVVPSSIEPYIKHFPETNPCSEIKMNDTNNTPHSLRAEEDRGRVQNLNVQGRGLNGVLTVEDESTKLKINVPGVEPERVEVKLIDERLRVRVLPEKGESDFNVFDQRGNYKQLDLILTAEEKVQNVKLALGVLEIDIDRGRTIETLEVNAE